MLREGILALDALRRARAAPEELYEQLREGGIEQLEQVRVAYLEQNGHASIFRHAVDDEYAGLPIEPPLGIGGRPLFASGEMALHDGRYACGQCGETRDLGAGDPVPVGECGGHTWLDAVHSHEYLRRAIQRSNHS